MITNLTNFIWKICRKWKVKISFVFRSFDLHIEKTKVAEAGSSLEMYLSLACINTCSELLKVKLAVSSSLCIRNKGGGGGEAWKFPRKNCTKSSRVPGIKAVFSVKEINCWKQMYISYLLNNSLPAVLCSLLSDICKFLSPSSLSIGIVGQEHGDSRKCSCYSWLCE